MLLGLARLAALTALPLLAALGGCGHPAPPPEQPASPPATEQATVSDASGGQCVYQTYRGSCELVEVFEEARPSSCGDRDGEILAFYRPTAASWFAPDQAVEVSLITDSDNHRAALRLISNQEQVPCSLQQLSKGSCAPEKYTIDLSVAPLGWTEADKRLVTRQPKVHAAGVF